MFISILKDFVSSLYESVSILTFGFNTSVICIEIFLFAYAMLMTYIRMKTDKRKKKNRDDNNLDA